VKKKQNNNKNKKHIKINHEGILMRGKNGRNFQGKFPPTTGHREK
jgi:hypothetical protein